MKIIGARHPHPSRRTEQKGGMDFISLIQFKHEFPQGTLDDFIRFTKTRNPRAVWEEYHEKKT